MTPIRPRLGRLLSAIALLGAVLGGTAASAHAASFQVSPTRFEFSLAKRFTNFFTVTNNSDSVLRLRVSTAFLEPDARGDLVPFSGSPYDMASWLVVNPRRMNVAPGEKRVVRFTVRPPGNLATGEYRTVVFFEELPHRPNGEARQGSGFEIRFLTRIGITIYGIAGNPTASPHAASPTVQVNAQGVHVRALLSNTGNARATLDCTATLLDADGSEQGTATARMVVQRDQKRPVTFSLTRPAPGDYRVRLTVSDGKQSVLETDLPVTVSAVAK